MCNRPLPYLLLCCLLLSLYVTFLRITYPSSRSSIIIDCADTRGISTITLMPPILSFPRNATILEEEISIAISKEKEIISRILRESPYLPTPDKNSEPIRTLIVSTWRSGSSFLGEAVASYPLTFYHYEPLQFLSGVKVFRENKSESSLALEAITNIFHCNFDNMSDYLKNGFLVYKNDKNAGPHCAQRHELCQTPTFLTELCKMYSVQTVKTVRLGLDLAERLLQQENELNLRVVYLARDPRPTMNSRRKEGWCKPFPDCWETKRLCNHLVRDFHAAEKLRSLFPQTFMYNVMTNNNASFQTFHFGFRAIRYEDLAQNMDTAFPHLMSFLRLDMEPQVHQFVASHTNQNSGDSLSTTRNSRLNVYKWISSYMQEGMDQELESIQSVCQEAMELWGYKPINVTTLKSLNPLDKAPWDDLTLS